MATHTTVVAFDICVLLSVLLILCTLVPAMLSKSVVRSPSWYNLIVAWLVNSLSYGLLVGRQESPDQPQMGLCLTQTLLIYAVPALVTSATFILYIELSLILRELRSGNSNVSKRRRSFWLVVTPWFIFIVIIIEVALLIFPGGRFHLVGRTPTNFYCHLADNLPSTITGGVAVAIGSIMLPLQVWLAVTIYRSSDALRRLAEADRQLFITLYIRLTLTTLATFMGFGTSSTLGYFGAHLGPVVQHSSRFPELTKQGAKRELDEIFDTRIPHLTAASTSLASAKKVACARSPVEVVYLDGEIIEVIELEEEAIEAIEDNTDTDYIDYEGGCYNPNDEDESSHLNFVREDEIISRESKTKDVNFFFSIGKRIGDARKRQCLTCRKERREKWIVAETTTLRRHMASAHKSVYYQWALQNNFKSMLPANRKAEKHVKTNKRASQSTLDPYLTLHPPSNRGAVEYYGATFTQAVLEWIAVTNQPLSATPPGAHKEVVIPSQEETREALIDLFKMNPTSFRGRLSPVLFLGKVKPLNCMPQI
ncbi:hypothetical protein AGABI1DRAFT_94030 [Agaricus bisporus var. burnettii JB137-S8]|uniref:Uncharacterized protein n=1 Tax=Agaricus bisporus var. burnettii (strain JB137-S8 / ATCC MYA-4627 / FGSC 10392) TaxID=597362 RepID=K5XPI6_AGABU|nr:uncharacterized protein AGABI1DRAFT_94030 [Agaricus bisporus var. burnettii JB137-S8]EKM76615.1 hypothetical protein AGABI1DRAFT_94030 [Agaricus bisporus var. burnettii JB137-S8]